MKAYKAAALPIIKAMNILTKDLQFENKLSLDERKEINQKVYEDVSKRLKTYETKLAAHIAVNGLTTDDEVSYEQLRNLTVRELKSENSYNVIAKKRDITNQKNYKIVIKKSKPTVVEENSATKSENNNQQETSKKKTTYKVHVNKNHSKKSNKSSKLHTAKAMVNDWTISEPVEGEFVDINDENTKTFHPSSDTIHINRDDINFDDILNPGDNNNNILDDGNIDDSYQDNNGNLDSSVKDPTTDSTGAVNGDTSLPDPNASGNQNANEVVADQIVEDMANNPTSTDSIKVFYKK